MFSAKSCLLGRLRIIKQCIIRRLLWIDSIFLPSYHILLERLQRHLWAFSQLLSSSSHQLLSSPLKPLSYSSHLFVFSWQRALNSVLTIPKTTVPKMLNMTISWTQLDVPLLHDSLHSHSPLFPTHGKDHLIKTLISTVTYLENLHEMWCTIEFIHVHVLVYRK